MCLLSRGWIGWPGQRATLLNVIAAIADRGAGFKSLKDAWADTTSAHGRLMLTVLGGLAEFERELIRARTGEGRKRAKERGVRFGRPRKMIEAKRTRRIAVGARLTGSSRRTRLALRLSGKPRKTGEGRSERVAHGAISRVRKARKVRNVYGGRGATIQSRCENLGRPYRYRRQGEPAVQRKEALCDRYQCGGASREIRRARTRICRPSAAPA